MTHVLVPLAVLKGETVSPGLIDLLGTVNVTVLGYHVLPEQTPPDQARQQYEERANAALVDVTDEFEAAGGNAYHRLVFTHDRSQTVDRIADEIEADAIGVRGATGAVERLLISVTGEVAVDRVVPFVVALVGDRDIEVTVFAAVEEGGEEGARERLDDAAARLDEAGIEATTDLATGKPFDALVDAAVGHDAVVMGERAPSLQSFLFGEEAERVASETVGPVLVVRAEPEVEPVPEGEGEAEPAAEPEGEADPETEAEPEGEAQGDRDAE